MRGAGGEKPGRLRDQENLFCVGSRPEKYQDPKNKGRTIMIQELFYLHREIRIKIFYLHRKVGLNNHLFLEFE